MTSHHELKRFNILQTGLVLGVLYAAGGLILGLLYGGVVALMGIVGASAASSGGAAGGAATGGGPSVGELAAIFGGLGLFAVIVFPLLYGALGFIGGIIGALFYNLAAKVIGGLKYEVADLGQVLD